MSDEPRYTNKKPATAQEVADAAMNGMALQAGRIAMLEDALAEWQRRAEYAESRLASISGVTRQALVERAVRETVEACLVADGYRATNTVHFRDAIRLIDPAPIVRRVLGGGE